MESSISFSTKSIPLVSLNFESVRSWINLAVQKEGSEMGEINFVFCTDEELLDINVEFLQHDAFTDIITFDYSTEGHISGEIFISHDRVVANATRMQIPVVEEFHRIIIHGVLHLLGYNDKSTIEKSIMTSKEEYYLSLQTKF